MPSHSGNRPAFAFGRGSGRGARGYYGYGYGYGNYFGYGYPGGYWPDSYYSGFVTDYMVPEEGNTHRQPTNLVVMPQEPPSPPPPPAKAAIHEYTWPASPAGAPQAFSLAMKDGTVRQAIAVWVQDGVLHYHAQNGGQESSRLDLIDIDLTHRLNAEKGLQFAL